MRRPPLSLKLLLTSMPLVVGLIAIAALGVRDAVDAQGSAASEAWIRVGISGGALFLALMLGITITRSVTRRLRHITREVSAAEEQLPALQAALTGPRTGELPVLHEIEARGSDEIAAIARSFNAMRDAVHRLADGPTSNGTSNVFVTMARRTRGLVDRQLTLLDELEADETDPDVLAGYYRLDHLATRMRRNSDSLLVLAGAETSRRRMNTAKIDTVVRAAVGEVEEYQRIDVESLEPVWVNGRHVADLAHLLAELLDNATAFSAPGCRVRVEGSRIHDHRVEDGSEDSSLVRYRIVIRDEGVGMERRRLEEMNAVLATPPAVGGRSDATIGMSVISLLAARHGVEVRLSRPADEGGDRAPEGLIAEVLLPAVALEPQPEPPREEAPRRAAIADIDPGFTAPPGGEPVTTLPPPPPVPTTVGAEFAERIAPPTFAHGPVARPVVGPGARPAPRLSRPVVSVPETTPGGLPVRSRTEPARGEQPRVEARLTDHQPTASVTASTSSPSALSAALSAFANGRRGHPPTEGPSAETDDE